ncbi:ATP-dependent Clp protease proteolytic subunit [uncultured bacterium]|nr:ATP-dependent Clp protease proteolytic subunit [uncultured bacterium]
MIYIPNVFYKKDGFKDQTADLFSRMLNMGCIFINGPIDDNVAALFLAQSQHIVLDLKINNINLFINSPGGELYSGLAITDIIKFGFIDVKYTITCFGLAASAASIILAVGHERKASVNSKIMIHQPLGSIKGQASDIDIYAKNINKARDLIALIYAKHSKKSKEYYKEAIDRDCYLSAHEALEIGLIDRVFGEPYEDIMQ